jgi:hypothetical protein
LTMMTQEIDNHVIVVNVMLKCGCSILTSFLELLRFCYTYNHRAELFIDSANSSVVTLFRETISTTGFL